MNDGLSVTVWRENDAILVRTKNGMTTWYWRAPANDEYPFPRYFYAGSKKGPWIRVHFWCLRPEVMEAFQEAVG